MLHSPSRRRTRRRILVAMLLAAATLTTALLLPGVVGAASALGAWAVSGSGHATDAGRPSDSAVDAGPPTAADGVISGGSVSVFDDTLPAVTKLDPNLLAAVRAAASAAGPHIRFVVNSGWRSPRLQEQMLQDAIVRYGSRAEAEKWVATPDSSEHVKGDAVDIGPWVADDWLSQHGAAYGLCQIYANEAWHFELRPDAVAHGCPAMYADPTHDPRLQG